MAKTAKRSSKRRVAKRPKGKAARVLRALPAPVERMPLVRRAIEALDRGERRIAALTDEGMRDLGSAISDLEARVAAEVEWQKERTEKEARSWFARLRKTDAARLLRTIPTRAQRGVDSWLDRVGLVRKKRHLDLIERARKRATAALRKTRVKRAAPAAAPTP